MELHAQDEGRHAAGPEDLWGESWYHDFAAEDGSYGGYLRLGLYPNLGVAWYWVHLVRRGQPLVLIRDHEVPCPDPTRAALEIASDRVRGTWKPVQPLRAYRITTEGTGVALATPADAFHGEQGPEVPISLDLKWEGAAPCFAYSATTRFEQSAWVTGTVTIGDKHIDVHCPGQRDHSWGVRDWWLFPWIWCSGRLDDGTWWHCVRSVNPGSDAFQTGYIVDAGTSEWREVTTIEVDYALDADMLPTSVELTVADLGLRITPELHAPVLLESKEGKRSRFPRAMSAVTTPDGRSGHCWLEFNFPEDVDHLKS
ncbi:MAG: hypothetical protein WD598_17195 [Acidimicrobiia bacterium]